MSVAASVRDRTRFSRPTTADDIRGFAQTLHRNRGAMFVIKNVIALVV